MVRELFERLTAPVRGLVMRPIRSLHQAAYLLAGLTLASQLLALLRDRTFAHMFGAGPVLDLYYAAFRMPDLVFALVSSLVSAYVLIPRIAGMPRESVARLLSQSASFLVVLGGAICVLLAIWMPSFLALLYPDLVSSPDHAAFVLLGRILLVQPILLGLSGVLGSVTQVNRRFTIFALSPVLYNLGIIAGAVLFYPRWGLPGIGIGVVVGAVAYLLVNVPVVREAGVFPRLTMPRWALMREIVRDSVPRSLALGMGSVTLLALTAIASRLGTGAVAVFTLASNLEAVPLSLIGSSYAVAAFPALSEASTPEKRSEFARILSASARHIILWSVVFLGLIVVLRAHLVRVILGTGAFDWNATRLTAALLAVLAAGLVAQGLVLLFSRALYAVRQSWRPLLYQVAGGAITVVLALLLILHPSAELPGYLAALLRVSDVHGTGILLLALAASLGQIVLLFLSLHALKDVVPGLSRSLVRPFLESLMAAIVGGAATYGVLALEGGIAPLTTLASVFTQGFVAGMVGIAASAIALYLMGNEEFRVMSAALLRLIRFRDERVTALAPSAEEPAQP